MLVDRLVNTTKEGKSWTEATKNNVWNKGYVIPNCSPDEWRWDKCGDTIKWSEYGNQESIYGWEIDHIEPVSFGGGDENENLQPLNWVNNASKGNCLTWACESFEKVPSTW